MAPRQESAWLVSIVRITGGFSKQWLASRSSEVETCAELERVVSRHYGWIRGAQVSQEGAAGAIVEAVLESLPFPGVLVQP